MLGLLASLLACREVESEANIVMGEAGGGAPRRCLNFKGSVILVSLNQLKLC